MQVHPGGMQVDPGLGLSWDETRCQQPVCGTTVLEPSHLLPIHTAQFPSLCYYLKPVQVSVLKQNYPHPVCSSRTRLGCSFGDCCVEGLE